MRNNTYKTLTGHRGKIKGIQDIIKVALYSRSCEICGCSFIRKQYKSGIFEEWKRFFVRKTCSRVCKNKLICGKGNPNFKGIMPKCLKCLKSLNNYRKDEKKGNKARFCRDCFTKIITGIRVSDRKLNLDKYENLDAGSK